MKFSFSFRRASKHLNGVETSGLDSTNKLTIDFNFRQPGLNPTISIEKNTNEQIKKTSLGLLVWIKPFISVFYDQHSVTDRLISWLIWPIAMYSLSRVAFFHLIHWHNLPDIPEAALNFGLGWFACRIKTHHLGMKSQTHSKQTCLQTLRFP